jgi:hypothetical protein
MEFSGLARRCGARHVARIFFWDEKRRFTGVVLYPRNANTHISQLQTMIRKFVAGSRLNSITTRMGLFQKSPKRRGAPLKPNGYRKKSTSFGVALRLDKFVSLSNVKQISRPWAGRRRPPAQ